MPFISRDVSSHIVGVFVRSQFEGQEYIEESHPDFVAFLTARQAEIDAAQAERSNLRSQIQDETETTWLARTSEARERITLRLFKALEKRIR
jgi:hypothetical protein